jgi:hypothetical protein
MMQKFAARSCFFGIFPQLSRQRIFQNDLKQDSAKNVMLETFLPRLNATYVVGRLSQL